MLCRKAIRVAQRPSHRLCSLVTKPRAPAAAQSGQSESCRDATRDELQSETRYFITSLTRDERSAARLAQAIRGHWSVENKNHWKRDTSLWKEDASRPRKKASGGQVLALLRGAILRLHDAEIFESLNAGFHHHSAKPYAALRLLKNPPPQIN
jgi:predicted transposase YbfD/YdcC